MFLVAFLGSTACQVQTGGLLNRPVGHAGTRAGSAETDAPPPNDGDSPSDDPLRHVPGIRSPKADFYLVNLAAPSQPSDIGSYCPYAPWSVDPEKIPTSPVPELGNLTVKQVLATLEPLGRYCVTVQRNPDCTAPGGAGHVCRQSPEAGTDNAITHDVWLFVQSDILYEGTDHEQRRLPEVVGRPPHEALAAMEGAGFANVKVEEDAALCERGVVCDVTPGGGFYPPGSEVVLHVRPPPRPR